MAAGETWNQHGSDGTTTGLGRLSREVLGEVGGQFGGSPGQERSQSTPMLMALPSASTRAPRDTALVEAGASSAIRNAGDTPLAFLIVALTPADQAAGTPVARPREPYDTR